jgi:hypothetical protein
VDSAATSFKAAVALNRGDALSFADELVTAAAAQLKPNLRAVTKGSANRFWD